MSPRATPIGIGLAVWLSGVLGGCGQAPGDAAPAGREAPRPAAARDEVAAAMPEAERVGGDDGLGAASPDSAASEDPGAPRAEALSNGLKRFHAAGISMDYPSDWSFQARKIELERGGELIHAEIVTPAGAAGFVDVFLSEPAEVSLQRALDYYPTRMGGIRGEATAVEAPVLSLLGQDSKGKVVRLRPKAPANPELEEVRIEAHAARGAGLGIEAALITDDLDLAREEVQASRAAFLALLGSVRRPGARG